MKKIILLLIAVMVFSTVSFADNSRSPIERTVRVTINNQDVSFLDQSPVIENDRVLVPIRDISENLGFVVEWIDSTQEIILIKQDSHIEHVINMKLGDINIWTKKTDNKAKQVYLSKSYFRNYELDSPAKVINGRTMLPLRIISEIIGCEVEWDNRAYKVIITKEKDDLEYLDVYHYKNNIVKKIKNENLETAVLEAFIEGKGYTLAMLDSQISSLYETGNFVEVNLELDRGANILKLNNSKAKRIIIILEDGNNFSKGTIISWNEANEIRAWGASVETLDKVIKSIN